MSRFLTKYQIEFILAFLCNMKTLQSAIRIIGQFRFKSYLRIA